MNADIALNRVAIESHRPQRISWRLVVFLGIICLPLAWFFFVFAQEAITGGVERHGDYISVDLKALGNFPFNDEGGTLADVPSRFRELDGKRVTFDGMMSAGSSAADQATECQLVYNVQKCCFNGPPLVQERVFLSAPGGKAFPLFHNTLVHVVGTLHVRLKTLPGGKIISLYDMTLESVAPRW